MNAKQMTDDEIREFSRGYDLGLALGRSEKRGLSAAVDAKIREIRDYEAEQDAIRVRLAEIEPTRLEIQELQDKLEPESGRKRSVVLRVDLKEALFSWAMGLDDTEKP